jgi:zinc protease
VLIVGPRLAGDAAAKISSPLWPHEQSDLAPDRDVVFGRLPNGLRYALRHNQKPRDRVSLHLVVNAGSINETDSQQGIAHFLEHMLFNGSTHFPPGELVKYFQKIGMQFGPDANASTSFFQTVYDINLPQGDRQSLEEALLVMGDYAEGALLLQSEIDREREVVLAEKRTRDSADYRTYKASMAFELEGTLFPRRLPIGTEAIIRQADRAVFKDFYDTWYRPDNMVLVMVGDFDLNLAVDLIADRFGDMSPRRGDEALPVIATGTLIPPKADVFYHHEAELGSTTLTIQVLKSIPRIVDSADYKKERLEDRLIGMILQNRLERLLNRPDPPFTEASAGIGTFLRQIRYGYISAECPPENWKAALATIETVRRQALRYGFDPREVERVRKDFLAELALHVDQAATRESKTLARGLIRTIAADRVYQSPRQEKEFYAPLLASLSAETLNGRLRQVWAMETPKILMTGNTNLTTAPEDAARIIQDVYRAAGEQPVEAPQITQSVKFPYLPAPSAPSGKPAARELIEDLGITRVALPNGIHLNLKPTDFSDNEILFALSFEGGRSVEPRDRPGLAELSRDVINESGVGPLDREALQVALTGKTTHLSFDFSNDRFFFEGATSPKEIQLLFQLLHAHLIDPAFRPAAYHLAQDRFAQAHQQMAQSIDGAFRLEGYRFLSGGDPRFGKPQLEEFQRLRLADVERWVKPILAQSPLELSLVGDFDLETAIALAQQYLGGLPARRSASRKAGPGPVFPAGRQHRMDVGTQIDKALLVLAFLTDDARDIQRTRRLNVLADVFSDRLREEIREKRGAAYSPGAYSWPSRAYPGFGLFLAYLPVAPGEVAPVLTAVQDIARKIAAEGIRPPELQRALEPTLTGIREQLRQNRYWLNTVLAGSTGRPEQIEWSRTIAADYASIQAEELVALAQRYLDPAQAAVFEARPQVDSDATRAENPSGKDHL